MATATLPPPQVPVRVTQRQRRFSVAEYHKLGELGILTPADRCELIHGFIVEKAMVNPPHATAVRRLRRLLEAIFTETWLVDSQSPITLADSEPEPDAFVARGTSRDFENAHPTPSDLAIVAEVSDSSLEDDRTVKLALYAAAKLPQYWIVNIPERRVEVYTQPRGGRNPTYRTRTDYGTDAAVPVVLAGKTLGTIPVAELLP